MEPDRPPSIALRPAPVLAGVGTFLLIAAAVSFVSARWDRFGPGDRFLALVVFSAIVFGLSAALRRAAPVTTRSLDVLIAALVPVDVAALAVVSGAAWPTVLLAAGPAAVVAAETLRRRDPSVVTDVGTVAGGVLAMCGVAAHDDIALAPLVAGLGLVGCATVPWNRERSAGPVWALLAGLAPALRVLDEAAFTGDGTMRRLGLLDATPWEATLVAGFIATVALGIATMTRRSLTAAVGAGAVVVATTAAMWAEHQPPRSLLVVAAAVVVALVEIALTHRSLSRAPALREAVAGVTAVVNGGFTVVVAAFALAAVLPPEEPVGAEWVYVAAALAFAWAVADVRAQRAAGRAVSEGGGRAFVTWGAATTSIAGVGLAAGGEAAGVVALGLGVLALATRRAGRLSAAWVTGVGAPLLLVGDWRFATGGALVGVLVVAVAAAQGHRDHDEPAAVQSVVGVLVPVTVAVVTVGEHSPAGAGVVGLGLLWLAATIVDVRMPSVALGLRGLGAVGVTAVAVDDPEMVGLALLASAVGWVAHQAATRQASSVFLAAWSAALGSALLLLDVVSDPVVVFAAAVGGGGVVLAGWGTDRDVGSARAVGGFVVWWASLVALAGAEVGILEPYVLPVLVALGWGLHREARTERAAWVAVGLPVALAAVVAFGQRVDAGPAGHTIVFGVVGLALCTLGAVRRHQPALVMGAAATVAVGAFEALDQVVGIESWSWLVVSGAAAITVAAALELTEPDVERDLVG